MVHYDNVSINKSQVCLVFANYLCAPVSFCVCVGEGGGGGGGGSIDISSTQQLLVYLNDVFIN